MVSAVRNAVLLVFRTPPGSFSGPGGVFLGVLGGLKTGFIFSQMAEKIVDFPKSSQKNAFFLVPAAPVGLAFFAADRETSQG